MYAKEKTTRQISDTIEDIYGVDVSDGFIRAEGLLISDVTDKILVQIEEWQNRPLDDVYPVISIDAIHYFSQRQRSDCQKSRLWASRKTRFLRFFSRLRRVVTRWIIASYNIAFSKLPLKTVVFRGSLMSFLDLPVTGVRKCCRLP